MKQAQGAGRKALGLRPGFGEKMQAVILAAGLGKRLCSITSERPKALVPVAGRELIVRAMDFLDHPAISGRIVVTGYKSRMLAEFVAARFQGVKTVENPHFRDGSIRSIEAALPLVRGDLLVMNVDHIYPARLMEKLASSRSPIAAACDFDRKLGPDDMKVKLSGEGRLSLISKALADFDGGYIGMTRVGRDSLPIYREAVAEARRSEGDACAVERALGRLAGSGARVEILDTSGVRWLEVDTPEDLALAEETLRLNPEFLI